MSIVNSFFQDCTRICSAYWCHDLVYQWGP